MAASLHRRAGRARPKRNGSAQLSAEAYDAVVAARNAFVSLPHRPSGVGGRTAAFGRLVDDLDWFDALAREQPAPACGQRAASPPSARRSKRRSRRRSAAPPSGCAPTTPATAATSCAASRDDHRAIGRAFLAELAEHRVEDDAQRVTAELNEAYRLRGLAFAALQIGRHAVQASGGEAPREPTLTPTPQRPARGPADRRLARRLRARSGSATASAARPGWRSPSSSPR